MNYIEYTTLNNASKHIIKGSLIKYFNLKFKDRESF